MTIALAGNTAPAEVQRRLDERLVSLLNPVSFEADQYRMLRYAVEQACGSKGSRVIAVTSAVPGDGKTLTAINLAGTIAKAGQEKVLLIDADLRRPAVGKVLGHEHGMRSWGLADAILDHRLTLDQICWTLDEFNLTVITSRRPLTDTYELIASAQCGAIIREARNHFDYVIVDTPPVLPAPDSRLLAEFIDGYVVVVSADKTPRRLLEETLSLLDPSKVLGLVFNREALKNSRYGRYYYAYHAR